MRPPPRIPWKLSAGIFGALCLIGPQWGGSYAGAWIVDGVLTLLLAGVRSLILAALVAWVADPALLSGKRSLVKLLPLALMLLATTQVLASLGTAMPLLAQYYAGEAWLEALYPHGQLIWVALTFLGWALAFLIISGWTKRRYRPVSKKALGMGLVWLTLWALAIWGLKVLADHLAMEDASLVALLLDGLTLAGPASILACMLGRPEGDAGGWSGVFGLLWAPAILFFSSYGVILRMTEAMADYGVTRPMALLPLDILGDIIRVIALSGYAIMAIRPLDGRALTGKGLWRLWPVPLAVLTMELSFGYNIFYLEEMIYAGEYQVAAALLWAGAAILWQTLTLGLTILIAGWCLKMRPLPWRVLPIALGLTVAELFVLLLSYGFALHPAGYSFGMALAVQLPYSRMIGVHALLLAALVNKKRKKDVPHTDDGHIKEQAT